MLRNHVRAPADHDLPFTATAQAAHSRGAPMARTIDTMTTTRRGLLAATLSLTLLGLTGCGSSTDASTAGAGAASATASSSASSSASASAGTTSAGADSPDLATLQAEVASTFTQETYTDATTGTTLPYNVYVPADYDAAKTYPLVLYIADSSLVGQDVTAPLSQYGALIWASSTEQAEHESIVVVPEYPEVIIDDHGSFTTTDYWEMTRRLVQSVSSTYSVDPTRVYGTGQSMGAMTVMSLAATYPDLFAAELIVSGQWDITQLQGLAGETFTYTAAGGDENASGGQTDVQAMLDTAGVAYSTTELDATASAADQDAAVTAMYAAGDSANFATFTTGTVLTASGSSSSGGMGANEHMASFQPAYEIAALRDWLFAQTA